MQNWQSTGIQRGVLLLDQEQAVGCGRRQHDLEGESKHTVTLLAFVLRVQPQQS